MVVNDQAVQGVREHPLNAHVVDVLPTEIPELVAGIGAEVTAACATSAGVTMRRRLIQVLYPSVLRAGAERLIGVWVP